MAYLIPTFFFLVAVTMALWLLAAFFSEPLFKVLHRLGIIKAVWLIDFDREPTLSRKVKYPLGGFFAHRFPVFGPSRICILLDNGQVQQPNYVKEWKPY